MRGPKEPSGAIEGFSGKVRELPLRPARLLKTAKRQLVREFRRIGPAAALKRIIIVGGRELRRSFSGSRDAVDEFDRAHGTETAAIVPVGGLDITDDKLEHTNRYEAVMPAVFDAIIRQAGIESRQFLFIDLGSGKGRALLLASRYSFKEIIGVEFSERLTARARENVRIFHGGRMTLPKTQLICDDALNYVIPLEKSILYLYNPFDESSMRALVQKVEQSLQSCPREIYVAYLRPVHRAVWDDARSLRLMFSNEQYVLYKSTAI